ncbi:MAG: peroxiredoxin-like family protein [Cyclobacteriaceae bacterium]
MTNLLEELQTLSREVEQQVAPRLQQVLRQFVESLRRQHASERSLQVGDTVNDFVLKDQRQRSIRLYEQLAQGPVVLTFFRGGWCPYCNLTLRAWRYALPDIEFLGARFLAVSPESSQNTRRTVEKNRLDFPVLHDQGSEVARSFKVSVVLSDYMAAFYRSLGLNLLSRNTDIIARLPMPATYLIDQQAVIRYAFVEEDYTQQADIQEVLHQLEVIRNKVEPVYA